MLNVLMTDHGQAWADHLPQLLRPQGVQAYRVRTVEQALRVMDEQAIHAAVVDLGMPGELGEPTAVGAAMKQQAGDPGGLRFLRVIQRRDPHPPTVVVRDRAFESQFDNRMLQKALQLEAFTVLDQPVQLEQLLSVLQRIVQRFYQGRWPEQ